MLLNTAGPYTLAASDGNYTGATSHSLTINATSAAKVVFQQAPSAGSVGHVLTSVKVAVEDRFGNVVTTNNSNVTLTVASGPGSFAAGSTTTVAAVNGIATFNNLTLSAAGAYTLKAADGSLTTATSSSITIGAAFSAPQNVSLTAVSSTSALLSWSAVSGATGYRVYQVIGTQASLLGSVGSNATSVQINGLTAGSTASFKLEAFNATSVADSSVVSVTLPHSTTVPLTVSATVLSSNTVQLSWNAIPGAQSYQIYWSSGSSRIYLGSVSSRTTSVNISGLTSGTLLSIPDLSDHRFHRAEF